MRDFFKPSYWKYRYIALYLIVYLVWFVLLERVCIAERYAPIYMPIDDKIPLLEGFVIPYVIWYPFMVLPGIYWFIKYPKDLSKYMWAIAIGFSLSMLICTVFPNMQQLRPTVFPRNNLFTRILEGLYRADTNTNVLPSVHVVGSMITAMAICDCARLKNRRYWPLKVFTCLIAACICVSIVFVKQHSLWDLIAALPVGLLPYVLVYKGFYKKLIFKKQLKDQ